MMMYKNSKIFKVLGVLAFSLASLSVMADEGEWTIYSAYHDMTKSVKIGSSYYVLANGDLFSYDTEDNSISTYDKSNVLSDFGIYDIAYSKTSDVLLIIYSNCNIDLLRIGKECVNLPDLKNKSLSDKTIYEVNITGNKAYISTGAGIVVVNLDDCYFENLYYFGSAVETTRVSDLRIYASTTSGVYVGEKTDNLLDPNNWSLKTDTEMSDNQEYSGLTNENVSDTSALNIVTTAIPYGLNSPVRNYSYKLSMVDGRLLVAGGNFYYEPEIDYDGTAMKYEDGKWTNFDETVAVTAVGSLLYRNVTDIIQDPKDTEHHWLGTKKSGIYEFRNYIMTNHYSYDNSPLTSILPENKNAARYVRVTGLQYDPEGNIWMCNNECDTVIRILKNDGIWISYFYDEIAGYPTFDNIMFDSRGWAWINCRRTTQSCSAGMMVINTNGTVDTQDDDSYRFIKSFYNQNGTYYTPNLFYCSSEDLNGYIWIGTEEGLFVSYSPDNVFSSDFVFNQVVVSRNDGSNNADYLLNRIPVKCIAIDGGNRKWIGTKGDGVYLISSDGQETVQHFTTKNSPLISDNINDIEIDGESGEVFIATTSGLCSYAGDATDASSDMSDGSLKVYPNPVRPEYSGNLHITGLMFDSNVKIVNAAGRLVTEGTSVGGEFTWNCCDNSGKRCKSGVYYALCCDENGNTGAATKFVIIR